MPRRIENCDEKINKSREKLDRLHELRPTRERLVHLKTNEIPDFEAKIKDLESDIKVLAENIANVNLKTSLVILIFVTCCQDVSN